MSDPTSPRLGYTGPPLSGPGLITSNSHITNSELLSDELFNKWYETVHIPDVLATGAVRAAYRFRNADQKAQKPYLAVYFVPDLAATQSEAFKSIPMTHDSLPNGASIHTLAHFDTRFYSLTQEDVKEELESGLPFPKLLLAAMEPGPTPALVADMDAWYRREHLEQMSKEPGWHRSVRYSLIFQVGTTDKAPSFLALYEFDEKAKLGTQVQPLNPMTEWTLKCMKEAQKIEAGVYIKIGSFSA